MAASPTYKIEIARIAAKAFDDLPQHTQRLIQKKIDALALEPRPIGVEKLAGEEALYRIRSGDYRIIYQIQDKILYVLVVKIGHRREVYRKR
jgi:mRNA interferase RelE/StbE